MSLDVTIADGAENHDGSLRGSDSSPEQLTNEAPIGRHLLPINVGRSAAGRLTIAGVDMCALAEEVGTPVQHGGGQSEDNDHGELPRMEGVGQFDELRSSLY